jgi:hypothetical protein
MAPGRNLRPNEQWLDDDDDHYDTADDDHNHLNNPPDNDHINNTDDDYDDINDIAVDYLHIDYLDDDYDTDYDTADDDCYDSALHDDHSYDIAGDDEWVNDKYPQYSSRASRRYISSDTGNLERQCCKWQLLSHGRARRQHPHRPVSRQRKLQRW